MGTWDTMLPDPLLHRPALLVAATAPHQAPPHANPHLPHSTPRTLLHALHPPMPCPTRLLTRRPPLHASPPHATPRPFATRPQAEIEKVQKRREEKEAEKARMEEELVRSGGWGPSFSW